MNLNDNPWKIKFSSSSSSPRTHLPPSPSLPSVTLSSPRTPPHFPLSPSPLRVPPPTSLCHPPLSVYPPSFPLLPSPPRVSPLLHPVTLSSPRTPLPHFPLSPLLSAYPSPPPPFPPTHTHTHTLILKRTHINHHHTVTTTHSSVL